MGGAGGRARRGRLGRPHALAARVVAEGPEVAVRREPPVARPSQAAPQPNPAIPKRSSRSANGHSSSSRNGSAARAMNCSHMIRGCYARADRLAGRAPVGRPRQVRPWLAGDRRRGSAGTAARSGRTRRAGRARRDRRPSSPAPARRPVGVGPRSSRRAVATSRPRSSSSSSATAARTATTRSIHSTSLL